ncbi:MAG: sensor histidine kinase [Acidimicrobiales bacterium]
MTPLEPDTGGRRRFGVQRRAIIAFALGAALVSATLALATFFVVRHDLVSHRVSSVVREAFVNARLVKVELRAPTANVDDALNTVTTTSGARSLIYRHGLWFSNTVSASGTSVPPALVRAVAGGSPAQQLVVIAGQPTVVVGVPLRSIEVSYFEEHSLTELQSTLNVLATVLTTVAIATTVGGALAGWAASRRLIRPLSDIARVATDIAGGTLERRLPDDPDLQPLVTSFNGMVGALQRRIERDARFASDVTHELRSPLTTIGASVELLGSYRERLPDGGTRALDTLQFEVERFSTMVQDLLEIARTDAGAAELHMTEVPLDELVVLTVSRHDPGLPVLVAPAAVGLRIRGDKRRLQRVLDNLLDNATLHAGGPVSVTVGVDGGWATVAVDDQGPGVPLAERERVFERFYRGAASGRRRATSGTGLGLALVAEHVAAHRGTVRIEDRPAGGTRVVVSLPIGMA